MRSFCFWVGGVVVWNEKVCLEAVKHWKLEEESEWGGLPRSEAPFLQYLFGRAEIQSSRLLEKIQLFHPVSFFSTDKVYESIYSYVNTCFTLAICPNLVLRLRRFLLLMARLQPVRWTHQPAFTLPLTLSARVADQEHGRCLKPWWMIWGGSLSTFWPTVVDAWSCGMVVPKSHDCVDIDPTRYGKGLSP